jgi:hypothetical protein
MEHATMTAICRLLVDSMSLGVMHWQGCLRVDVQTMRTGEIL